jgi:pentatricopeptide repeat protein
VGHDKRPKLEPEPERWGGTGLHVMVMVMVAAAPREYLWAREGLESLAGGGRGSGLLQMYTCLATCHAREGHPEAALAVVQDLMRAGLRVRPNTKGGRRRSLGGKGTVRWASCLGGGRLSSPGGGGGTTPRMGRVPPRKEDA